MTKGLQSRYFNLREEEHQMNSDLDELSCSRLHFLQSAMSLMQLVETDRRCWTSVELGQPCGCSDNIIIIKLTNIGSHESLVFILDFGHIVTTISCQIYNRAVKRYDNNNRFYPQFLSVIILAHKNCITMTRNSKAD